jgi:hypothetical protein
MKQLKLLSLVLSFLIFSATSIHAEVTTKQVCTPDSYGNQTCRDEVTNSETGVITYQNERVIYSTGEVVYKTSANTAEILNAGLPSSTNIIALTIVGLGAASFVLKRFI